MAEPVVRLLEPAEPLRAGDEAQVELGARAAQLHTRECESRQLLRAAHDAAAMVDPSGRAGPVLVGEPAEVQQVLRELPLRLQDRQPGVHLARPVIGRPAGDRPAHAHGEARAPEGARLRTGPRVLGHDALLRDAVEEAGLALAADVDLRRVGLHQLAQPLLVPGREDAECVGAAVHEPRAHDERIRGDGLDRVRAAPIGGRRDGHHQLTMRGCATDDDRVAALERDGLRDRVRVPLEQCGLENFPVVHGSGR